MTPYYYARGGDGLYTPTGLAQSPWEPGKQNGVALGGLLVHLIETIPAPAPMTTARLTIDILSTAPLADTEGRTRVVRDGKRIQMVEAELLVDGRVVARATALRTRIADSPPILRPSAYPPPDACAPIRFLPPRAFGGTLETRAVHGNPRDPGPGALWIRFGHEHIAGVPLSPLTRVAIMGDFGGGVGAEIDSEEWSFANLDIALHLTREPEGEWLLVEAETMSAGNGIAHSNMTMADERGIFAKGHQTLFIAPRG